MLRDAKNDLFHLLNILESIGKIRKYTENIDSPEQFIDQKDQMIYNASLTLLANIGESIWKLSEYSTETLSGLDLNAIRGMRNRIVHDYSGLNSYIIFEVTKSGLNDLKKTIEKHIKESILNHKFDEEEYQLSVASPYYRHIDFKLMENKKS